MALPKITETQMNENGVIAAPDILTGNPQENKALFDRMVRQLVAPAYNACAEAVDTINAAQKDWTGKEMTRQEQEKTRQEQEAARQTAEGTRAEAERTRETNEQGRTDAEQLRTEAENGREQAEALRYDAEEIRASAERERAYSEESRKTAENNRIDGEKVRQNSEAGRIGAENERITSEEKRRTAESTREGDEEKRRTAETQRATAESERTAAEEMRESKERSREKWEDGRQTAEDARAKAEQARQSAESNRAFSEEKRAAAESARTDAERERETAERNRAEAENNRETAERVRDGEETKRETAERTRERQESDRNTAMLEMQSAEENRQQAEQTRAAAESARSTAEEERAANEQTRMTAESQRQQNENARAVFEVYDATKAYVPGNKVALNGSSYVNTNSCKGIAPPNKAYWLLIAQRGADGKGSGDMMEHTYDPTGKKEDIFSYADRKAGDVRTVLDGHTGDSTIHVTAADKQRWDGKETGGTVAEHNTSSSAHADIRTAIGKKQDAIDDLATIRAGAKKGATAVQQSAVGKPSGVASLGTDGKVPGGQLPEMEVDAFTKAETLKDTTAALYGLGSDAVPDELFSVLSNSALRSSESVIDKRMFIDWGMLDTPGNFTSIYPIRKIGGKIYAEGTNSNAKYLLAFDGDKWETVIQTGSSGSDSIVNIIAIGNDLFYTAGTYLYRISNGTITEIYDIGSTANRFTDQAIIEVNGKLLFSSYDDDSRTATIVFYDLASGDSTTATKYRSQGIPKGTSACYKGGKYYFCTSNWQMEENRWDLTWSNGTSGSLNTIDLSMQNFPTNTYTDGALLEIGSDYYTMVRGSGSIVDFSGISGFAKLSNDFTTATYISDEFSSKFLTSMSSIVFENQFFEYENAYYAILRNKAIVKNKAKDLVSWEKVGELPFPSTDAEYRDFITNIGNCIYSADWYESGWYKSSTEYITKTFLTNLFGEHITIPDSQILGGVQIETGSYVGTGTYGQANPNSLTFGFEPKLVFISGDHKPAYAGGLFICFDLTDDYAVTNGYGYKYFGSADPHNYAKKVGNTLSWYYRDSYSDQLNNPNYTYNYLAIG